MKINWRERIIAASIHLAVTLVVSGAAAAVIFMVWFPDGLADVVGGRTLFWIVVACDLALGPLISLVVFDSKKSRLELFVDYGVVAALQLGALAYGLSVVAASRPVFVAFNVDRLDIVSALELDDEALAAGTAPRFQSRSWIGPRMVYIEPPKVGDGRQDILSAIMLGANGQLFPKYYRDYDSAVPSVLKKAHPIESLLNGSGDSRSTLEREIAMTNASIADLRWLLVRNRFGYAIALIDAQTGEPTKYLNVDPVWWDGRSSQATAR